MKLERTSFVDLFILETINFQDNRGSFQKLFNYDFFKEQKLDTDFKEFYYSVSQKNVIRGMHFQLPPLAHTKLVYVSKGSILDVVVDLRKFSNTYGKSFSIRLDSMKSQYLYIPRGFAHGFLSYDSGIAYDSIGFEWGVKSPIVSDRDLTFTKFEDFKSPFL